jgi:uncharacterized membrane protein
MDLYEFAQSLSSLGWLAVTLAIVFLIMIVGYLAYLLQGITTKACPFCRQRINKKAIVCRYCGRDLPNQI